MDEIAIKYDKRLTELGSSIFGNIVEKAYYTTWDFGDSSKAEILERLEDEKSDDLSSIDIGGKEIWITFTSGKTVAFSSSEWGDINKVEFHKVEIVEE